MSKNSKDQKKNPISAEILKQLKGLYRSIKKARGVIVAGHVNPDGDDIGSQLALGSFLDSIGKKNLVLIEEHPPKTYAFLPDLGLFTKIKDLDKPLTKEDYDLLIVVDSGDFDRIGDVRKVLPDGITVVNIDHHRGNTRFGDANIVSDRACSIGEILYYFFKVNGVPLTENIAVQLYVSIVTDTGSFKYDCMHPEVHLIAAELLEMGAVPSQLSIHLFQNRDKEYMKRLGLMLSKMEIVENGKIAVSVLTKEDFKLTDNDDTDGLIEYLGMVDSVTVYVLIKEKEEGMVSASLRSKHDVDVAGVAAAFGGGGHMRAAGCKTAEMDPAAFRAELIRLIKEKLQ